MQPYTNENNKDDNKFRARLLTKEDYKGFAPVYNDFVSKAVDEYGKGAVIYMKGHEGRGIGIINKIKAYHLQEEGQDTVEANISLGFKPDLRDYGMGAQIILDLGFNNFNLITNNPKKIIGLNGYGLTVHDIVKIEPQINSYNRRYMETKKEKMQHMF